jgi:Tfp pilus assembly protein PilX
LNGIKDSIRRPHANQSGSALITVLLVLIIMSTLAMGYMLTSTSQQMLSRNRVDDSVTFLAADAGIAYGMTNLADNSTWETQHLRNDKKPDGSYYMRSEGFLHEP